MGPPGTPESTPVTPDPDSAGADAAAPVGIPAGRRLEWSDAEKVSRLAAFAVLVLYVLGLLTVNIYLYQIGVTDFSVLRTRFILTGVLATLMLAALVTFALIGAATFVAFATNQREARKKGGWRSWLASLVMSEFVLFVGTVLAIGGVGSVLRNRVSVGVVRSDRGIA